MSVPKLKVALVSPSSVFVETQHQQALERAPLLDMNIVLKSAARKGSPSFLNGSKEERLLELSEAEALNADAIWCTRGGCGTIELWQDYRPELYREKKAVLIGYSDITLLHFLRFFRGGRIGIHGPGFFDLGDDKRANAASIRLLIDKKAHSLCYPPLKSLNHFVAPKLDGELIVMNLMLLQCAAGAFPNESLQGKILAIEDINEPHYRVHRTIHHLKNAGFLAGLRALIIGQFNLDRAEIIKSTMMPLAEELGIPLFDWPIFGHDKPNWPLLFGARTRLSLIDHNLHELSYLEQHDKSAIVRET